MCHHIVDKFFDNRIAPCLFMNTKTILEVFMKDEISNKRLWQYNDFSMVRKPESICTSLGQFKILALQVG